MADKCTRIKLPCGIAGADYLTVGVCGNPNAGVKIIALVGDERNTIFLNPEHARELFNWLGVYLHTVLGD